MIIKTLPRPHHDEADRPRTGGGVAAFNVFLSEKVQTGRGS